MRTTGTLVAALLLLLAGCCTGGSGGEDEASGRAAAQAFEAYAGALKKGDCAAAYALLSPALRRRSTLDDFKAYYAAHRDHFLQLAASKVDRPYPDGFRVALKITDGVGVTEWVVMVPEGSGWRVDDAGRTLAELCHRAASPEFP